MPARFVTLMNPRPRRAIRRVRRMRMGRNSKGRFTRRASSSRRRARVNPSPRVVYRTRTKIRNRTRTVTRIRRVRVHSNPPKMSTAMRRKVSMGVRRANARRRSPVRRFGRAAGGVASRFGGGSIVQSFKSALSSGMLMKAGGAVGASLGVGYILNKWGAKLPLANNQYGRVLYTFGVPVLLAYAVRKKSPTLAEGLVIGGLVMSINTLMQGFKAATAATVAAPAAAPATVGSFAVAGELGSGTFGYYPQGMTDGRGLGGSNVAFPQSAW